MTKFNHFSDVKCLGASPGLPHTQGIIKDVMQDYYADIQCVMSSNPASIAPALFSKRFIMESTLNATIQLSGRDNSDKANQLMQDCWNSVTTHKNPEERMQELLGILETANPAGANVAEKIREVSDLIAMPPS